jgi:FAD/FMN-containing dehydrogenase/Fe-S oxidoreductase
MPLNLELLQQAVAPARVLSDFSAITAYSIDAGIYKIPPQAIVLIESENDMEKVLAYARKHKVPLTARSGGTNLTGNAIGEGIILEFSRYNRILETRYNEKWARVEPGVVYAELNSRLARNRWMFAPDPSSGEVCKIGGMLGNNSAGAHALKYGTVKDNVLEMELLLASGNRISAREYTLDDPAFKILLKDNPPLAGVLKLIQENIPLILEKKKKVSKNSSGYNLFALAEGLQNGLFPLHQLFIGSEGTLALTIEAKIKLVSCPVQTGTALIYFKSLFEMSQAVQELLKLAPSALEMMDRNTLNLVGRHRFGIPADAEALLLVEFDESVNRKMEKVRLVMANYPLSAPMAEAYDPEKQAGLWKARKAINPALYQYDARKKPIHFVDDVVVPVDRIPELIPYLEKMFEEKNVAVAIYGHIGDGNAHINPLLDLNDPEDFSKMVFLYQEIHNAVLSRFNGSLCGEHGDGRVRAEFLKALYGPELYALFQDVKRLLDPDNILNPGVKLSDTPFTEMIDYERYAKSCATCGKCNAVCPVYDAAGEESNGARGWFHILTAQDYSYEKAGRVVEACLNCKSCRSACPAGIDVSELILKKRAEHPNPVAKAIFSFQARERLFKVFLKGVAWTQPFWDNRIGRMLIEFISIPLLGKLAPTARIPAEMTLPRFSKKHLRERYAELTGSNSPVAYFHGCAANYFNDGVGDSIIRLLRRNGIEPALPPQRCSGTPIQTYGLIDQVKENALFNIESLSRFEKVITGCASCTLMLKEYSSLFPEGENHGRAVRLASKIVHISEFILRDLRLQVPETGRVKKKVTYHSSCHLRAAGVSKEPGELLRQNPNIDFVEMADADRCAGGAGTFCIKNPKQSAEIFKRKERGILDSGAEIVATSCPACMIQLQNGLKGKGVEVKHIASFYD